MRGIYCWRDLNIYLVVFWVLLENKNQLHSKTWWWRGRVFEGEFVSIFLSWTTFIKKNIVKGIYLTEIKFKHTYNYMLFNYDKLKSLFNKHNNMLFSNNFWYAFELTMRHNLFLVPCLDEESFKVCFSSEKKILLKNMI
jgi:hypothetical protein